MKKLFVITLILVGIATMGSAKGGTGYWSLNITSKTTKAYLDSVSAAWAKSNIVLKFTELKFNSKGTKLLQVSGNIVYTTNDGQDMTGSINSEKIKKQIEVRITDKPSLSIDSK